MYNAKLVRKNPSDYIVLYVLIIVVWLCLNLTAKICLMILFYGIVKNGVL